MIEHVHPPVDAVGHGFLRGAVGRTLVLPGREDVLEGGEAGGAGGVEGGEGEVRFDDARGRGAEGLGEEGGVVVRGDGEGGGEGGGGGDEEGAVV